MLQAYLIALAIGGVLIVFTLFVGHDADADADADFDVDGDLDADIDAASGGGHGFGELAAWLPIASLRFWTFFLAFGGLAGTLLTSFAETSTVPTAVMAGSVGYLSGVIVSRVLRALQRQVVDSGLSGDDYLGEAAVVTLPLGPDRAGKVRMEIKGRVVELIAESDEDTLAPGDAVVVYEVREDGRVVVARAAQLPA